jgi:uncharacterized protein (TIGR02246 family)
MRYHTAALVAGIVVLGCTKQPDKPSVVQQGAAPTELAAVRQAIEAGNAGLIAAIEKGDSAAAASFYDPEGMTMPPAMDASVGRAEIAKMFGGMNAMVKITDMKLQVRDVVASGDLAVETGHYEWTLNPPKGKPMLENGKYVVAWRRQADGSWKLFRDIFNNDAPEKVAGK